MPFGTTKPAPRVPSHGSAKNDVLTGDNGDNKIDGGAGDDVIEGLVGADVLLGNTGIDTVSYFQSAAGVFPANTGFGHYDGYSHVVFCLREQGLRLLFGNVGGLRNDAPRTFHQFGISRLHVHHQIAVNVT